MLHRHTTVSSARSVLRDRLLIKSLACLNRWCWHWSSRTIYRYRKLLILVHL